MTSPTFSWTQPPLVRASLALHALALAAVLLAPATWPWALAAVVMNHVVLGVVGLWPRSTLLGPNVVRLDAAAQARGEVAITLDDGPDPEVTPAVLDLLQARGVRATFFCIARLVEAHPGLAREIAARGHALENHSDRHVHTFSISGPRAFDREIGRAQERIAQVTGHRPTCFRAPAGLRNPFLAPVLHKQGLRLVSWTRRGYDTRTADADLVLARLSRGLRAGDILLLHDGNAARDAQGRAVVLDVLPRLLDAIDAAGLKAVTVPQALDPSHAAHAVTTTTPRPLSA